MEKVKVTRYMPGRRPDYAGTGDTSSSSSSSSEEEGEEREEEEEREQHYINERDVTGDRRLNRLRERSTHIER